MFDTQSMQQLDPNLSECLTINANGRVSWNVKIVQVRCTFVDVRAEWKCQSESVFRSTAKTVTILVALDLVVRQS